MINVTWKKFGRIIKPKKFYWMKTHAMCPTPEIVSNNTIKIYFSGRNKLNQSIIGSANIIFNNFPNSYRVKYFSKPDLKLGKLGTFDDNGVTPTCIINHNSNKYLFYVGWNKGVNVRMHLFGEMEIHEACSSLDAFTNGRTAFFGINNFSQTLLMIWCKSGAIFLSMKTPCL